MLLTSIAPKERMARLLAAAESGETAFHRAHLGTRATVLWERPRGGMGHGLTDNYLRVFSEAAAGLTGRLTTVELVALTAGGVAGTPVNPSDKDSCRRGAGSGR